MKLNGWRRLWIAASIGWVVYCGWTAIQMVVTYRLKGMDVDASMVYWAAALIAVVGPILVYIAGVVVAWVVRGFRSPA